MSLLYSYVLRFDDGAAPNPFWDVCTLTICKPAIRRKAKPGSWVIGTGSKHSRCNDGKTYDFTGTLVYAMKIEDVKNLKDYDSYCSTVLPNKIPDKESEDWKLHVGDAIYDFSDSEDPKQRRGKHETEADKIRDLSGENALLSKHFYYFGENPILLPPQFQRFVKKNQGHKIIREPAMIKEFENWLATLGATGIRSEPQLMFQTITSMNSGNSETCAKTCSTAEPKKQSHGSNCNL